MCLECGATSPRWQGQFHSCYQWNTFLEELKSDPKKVVKSRAGFAGSIS
ncbi:DNA repair protein RadA, partial [Francisella tularensis subsp. holarctica]|nr:DNA repair protein RadA [Francisella tularensis subsp. holarctica]